ncbi:hypothetical protein C4588_06105 [Candidatus Parcubacteria bacterium]|nr:MAG: hypothetical protein C4588_06105 [Candidatus Parcubacteria bacterium]
MMEKPIIFSTAMVQAILDGKKTMTRRVVKNQIFTGAPLWGFDAYITENNKFGFDCEDGEWVCPYGQPGDLLFVRESWRLWLTDIWPNGFKRLIKYEADDVTLRVPENQNAWFDKIEKNGYGKRPSIHLPKFATRIWLEVTDVRVERLQSISDSDAIQEGVDRTNTSIPGYATMRFKELWDSINGKPRKDGVDISWAANPWVWTVSFKRIEK